MKLGIRVSGRIPAEEVSDEADKMIERIASAIRLAAAEAGLEIIPGNSELGVDFCTEPD